MCALHIENLKIISSKGISLFHQKFKNPKMFNLKWTKPAQNVFKH